MKSHESFSSAPAEAGEAVENEHDKQLKKYADFLKGNAELSDEELDKLYTIHPSELKDDECEFWLGKLTAQKVDQFEKNVRKRNNYGEGKYSELIYDQLDRAEHLLGISDGDFDDIFYDTTDDNVKENGKKVLLAFMRGDFKLTSEQASELFSRYKKSIKDDLYYYPYAGAINVMELVETRRKNMELCEKVFFSDDKDVIKTIVPFYKAIFDDKDTLMEMSSSLDIKNYTAEQAQGFVDFFAEKFGIGDDIPSVIVEDMGSRRGVLEHDSNGVRQIKIAADLGSFAEFVDVIAHETWHARQFKTDSEVYRFNFRHYVQYDFDMSLYWRQIVEKEAKAMGNVVGEQIREDYINAASPEEIQRMAEAYRTGAYKQDDTSGLDELYYMLAYEKEREINHRKYRGAFTG